MVGVERCWNSWGVYPTTSRCCFRSRYLVLVFVYLSLYRLGVQTGLFMYEGKSKISLQLVCCNVYIVILNKRDGRYYLCSPLPFSAQSPPRLKAFVQSWDSSVGLYPVEFRALRFQPHRNGWCHPIVTCTLVVLKKGKEVKIARRHVWAVWRMVLLSVCHISRYLLYQLGRI